MSLTGKGMGLGLRMLNRFAGSKSVDRLGLRKPSEAIIHGASRAGFASAGMAARAFKAVRRSGQAERPGGHRSAGLFDLTLAEDQAMLQEACQSFADEQMLPLAQQADRDCSLPEGLRKAFNELGVHLIGVPEALGGASDDRSAVSNVITAEALAHGDLGLAYACLAPAAVSRALVLWGNADAQATYLPEFVGDSMPVAALAVLEPTALFDPYRLRTKALRTPSGYVLEGEKSLVPAAAQAELMVVAAHLEGRGPALFIVESASRGVSVAEEPGMGLRAASTGRVRLNQVSLPFDALFGDGEATVYSQCVQLSRLAWCALAIGTSQAALDYIIPYVNQREAFGEPISHRQAVAFSVADMAIELESMRLLTWRAAGRVDLGKSFAEQAAVARKLCASSSMQIGSEVVQLLGGHGFVKEHPAERWYRDLRAVGFMEGGLLI